MKSSLPAIPSSNEGASADRIPACSSTTKATPFGIAWIFPITLNFLACALLLLSCTPALFGADASTKVRTAVAPKYPALTLAGRVDGVVRVRVTVDPTGAVKAANVLKGHPMLREAALHAAQQWQFEESSAAKRSVILNFSFVILPESSAVRSQTVFLPPTGIEIRQKPVEPSVEDQGGEFTVDPHPISTT